MVMRHIASLLVTAEHHQNGQSGEVLQRLAKEAQKVSQIPDLKADKARVVARDLAVMQVAAGDTKTALQTVRTIGDERFVASQVYPRMLAMLLKAGKVAEARALSSHIGEAWLFGGTSESNMRDAIRQLSRIGVISNEIKETLAWAREQENGFAKGYALLGIVEGLFEQHGIEDLREIRPEMSWRGPWICGHA